MSTLLVADDDEGIRELIVLTLAPLFGRVLEASDGVQALGLARAELPDLIVLDHGMPGLTGLQVVEQLELDPRTRAIPRVLLTGWALEELGPHPALAACLVKPFSAAELLACVNRARAARPGA